MNLNLSGRRALVCGASQGLGEACARQLAEQGAEVVLLARSLDTLGAMARTVADFALLRAALTGAPAEITPRTSPPTLAICRTPWWDR